MRVFFTGAVPVLPRRSLQDVVLPGCHTCLLAIRWFCLLTGGLRCGAACRCGAEHLPACAPCVSWITRIVRVPRCWTFFWLCRCGPRYLRCLFFTCYRAGACLLPVRTCTAMVTASPYRSGTFLPAVLLPRYLRVGHAARTPAARALQFAWYHTGRAGARFYLPRSRVARSHAYRRTRTTPFRCACVDCAPTAPTCLPTPAFVATVRYLPAGCRLLPSCYMPSFTATPLLQLRDLVRATTTPAVQGAVRFCWCCRFFVRSFIFVHVRTVLFVHLLYSFCIFLYIFCTLHGHTAATLLRSRFWTTGRAGWVPAPLRVPRLPLCCGHAARLLPFRVLWRTPHVYFSATVVTQFLPFLPTRFEYLPPTYTATFSTRCGLRCLYLLPFFVTLPVRCHSPAVAIPRLCCYGTACTTAIPCRHYLLVGRSGRSTTLPPTVGLLPTRPRSGPSDAVACHLRAFLTCLPAVPPPVFTVLGGFYRFVTCRCWSLTCTRHFTATIPFTATTFATRGAHHS